MKPTLLFLPGTLCDARVWQPCADILAADWLCVHADYRFETRIAGMAARALALADGPLIPIGSSMGGIVALEMWRQAPSRLMAMGIFDTNPGADTPARGARRLDQVIRARAGALADIVAGELAPMYAGLGPPNPRLARTVAAMANEHGVMAFDAQACALATREDCWPLLCSIDIPVLVSGGDADRICPFDMQQRSAKLLPQSTFAPLPGAGHLAPLEQPELAANIIRSWLSVNVPGATEQRHRC